MKTSYHLLHLSFFKELFILARVVAAVATEVAAQVVAIDLVVGAAAIVVAVEVVATVVEIAEAPAIVGVVADRVD